MILTVADARVTACFLAATFGGSQQITDGPGPHCVAMRCMAWRWFDTELEHHWGDKPKGDGWEDLGDRDRWDGHRAEKTRLWKRPNPARRGFCGLAGKPEES